MSEAQRSANVVRDAGSARCCEIDAGHAVAILDAGLGVSDDHRARYEVLQWISPLGRLYLDHQPAIITFVPKPDDDPPPF